MLLGIVLGIGGTLQAQNNSFKVQKDTVIVNKDKTLISQKGSAEETPKQYVFSMQRGPNLKKVSKQQWDSAVYKYNGRIITDKEFDSITKNWKAVGVQVDYTKRPIEQNIYETSAQNTEDSISIQTDRFVHRWSGKPLPELRLRDIKGNIYDANSLKGKVVVLNFWFLACKPCRQEMPELNELVSKYKGRGVIFLGLGLDGEDAIQKFLQKTPFNYSIVPNTTELSYKTFGISSWPTHIVVDQDGIIRLVDVGNTTDNLKQLKKTLAELVK